MRQTVITIIAFLLLNGLSLAQPAPWFKWQHKDKPATVVCAQTKPEGSWEKHSGPYKDNRCEKLANKNKGDLIAPPSAQQVLNFTDTLAATPATDKKVATEALDKWIKGTLTKHQAEEYKNKLNLSKDDESTYKGSSFAGSTEQCAACLAACCAWWGCNPACIAGCVAGICK